ncbi:hypothetical protein ES708_10761 [subsurface metagenome]
MNQTPTFEIAALSSKVRNDRGMDSRVRGNDIKGSGNDIKGSGNDIKGMREWHKCFA